MFKFYKFNAFAIALAAVVGTSMVSCSDDDGKGEGDDAPEVKEALSPTESKAYMEETAKMFLGKFNPADQADAVHFANYFCDEYGDLEAPAEWGLDDDDYWVSPANMMRTIAAVCNGDVYAASRGGYGNDIYDFDRFAGVYVPAGRYWIKESNSDDIVFKFKNASGKDCEIKATGDGSESSMTVDGVTVRVPKKVVVNVKEDGKTHADVTVESQVNESGHNATVKVDATVANVHTVANLEATDQLITMTQTVELSGSQIVKATASVKGTNMCKRSVIERAIRNEDFDAILDLMTSATAEADVLGRIQVKATASEFSKVADIIDNSYYDNYDYNSSEVAEAACKRDAETLNRFVAAAVYYNSDTKQADLKFEPKFEDYGYSYWEWSIMPALVFCSDGTSYGFDEYFGNSRFASVESLWESLIDNYERLWR